MCARNCFRRPARARGRDALIWAIFFVSVVGLGPFAGILAIAVKDTAILAKLNSEALENIDREQTRGVRATGAGPLGIARHGRPEIFNSDQGSQFTSPRFTDVLLKAGVKISMDGKGRWMNNVFSERLWRSLKYECVYLHAFETGSEARAGIGRWMTYYNAERPHSTHGGRTPLKAHAGDEGIRLAA